jgi:hypothetical protein
MVDATSIVTTPRCCPGVVRTAAMLFGPGEEFSVLRVDRCGPCAVKVIIEQIARDGPCPDCGVLSAVVKDRPLIRVRNLPVSCQAVELWWRKRRLRCGEDRCRRSPRPRRPCGPRDRGAGRLRDKLASAILGAATDRWPMSSPPSTGCHGRPRTKPQSRLPPTGSQSPSPRRCWGSMRPGLDRSSGFLTGSPRDGQIRG